MERDAPPAESKFVASDVSSVEDWGILVFNSPL